MTTIRDDRRIGSPLWLSHHRDEQAERCIRFGSVSLCRRCSVLYPTALVVMVVVAAANLNGPVLVAAMWLLPLPAAVEWFMELTGTAAYSRGRHIVTSILAGIALGAAFGVHLRTPFDPAATAPMLCWAALCVLGALWIGGRGGEDPSDWVRQHERDEAERHRVLLDRLDLSETDPGPH